MLKKYWLCLIGMGILTNLAAQGLPMDKASDQHYENLPRQPDFSDGGKAENEILTSTRQWSLKAHCPQPKNQLGSGACVGWSVGYAALTIQRAIANCWEGQTALITKQAFSPMFIYNQIKISDCQAGAYIDAAMHLLQTKGDVLATEFDKHSSDCSIMPTDKHLESAAQNKISAFHTLFSVKASKRTKIDRVKLSLIQNRPVVVGMRLLNNFTKLRRKDTYWQPTIGDQQPFGGHALVVVGFDDSRGAFELMNSWGKEWGKDGFIWVRYADFANYCRYGFQMEVKAKISEPKQYSGKFSLRRFETMTANGEVLFSEEAVRFNQGIYQLKNQAITTGAISCGNCLVF